MSLYSTVRRSLTSVPSSLRSTFTRKRIVLKTRRSLNGAKWKRKRGTMVVPKKINHTMMMRGSMIRTRASTTAARKPPPATPGLHYGTMYRTSTTKKRIIKQASNTRQPKGQGLMPQFRRSMPGAKPYNASLWPNISYFHSRNGNSNGHLSLPTQISNAFVISMRDSTLNHLRHRLGPWSSIVKTWPATNGRQINTQTWKRLGMITGDNRLTRGQIGCYDSHVSIWQTIVEHSLPMALILEDDAEMQYIPLHEQRLKSIFADIQTCKQNGNEPDLVYLGANYRNARRNTQTRVMPNLTRPNSCVGLFCYVITLKGARILLEQVRPYRVPIDIYTVQQANAGRIQALYADPNVGFVFSKSSDTRNIK